MLIYEKFLNEVKAMKDARDENGDRLYAESDIAEHFGIQRGTFRKRISEAHRIMRDVRMDKAEQLRDAGKTSREIAEELGLNESSVRLLLDKGKREGAMKLWLEGPTHVTLRA